MRKKYKTLTITTCICYFLLINCTSKKTELAWDTSFPRIGTQSSPRATDLNADGILDIIIGAGVGETGHTEQAIIALNGQTGEILWQAEAEANMIGAATLLDITNDGIKDIFIGGRAHQLKAINGKNGKLIWEYKYQYEKDPILQYARFNFYNSVLVPDQNQDNLPDLLMINGGNPAAEAGNTKDRYPGVLMLLDSKNGTILAADTMPDGKESYMSPIYFTQPNDEKQYLLFGTGGETIGGNLYLSTLNDLKQQNLKNAQVLATEQSHGFIAPPVLADINQDQHLDVIAIAHSAKIFAIDGTTQQVLWQQQFTGMESSNSFTVGYFNKDDIPDFFTTICKGVWPQYTQANHLLLDGKNGAILYQEALGCTGLAAATAYDLTRDGVAEVILPINNFDCTFEITADTPSPPNINTQIVAIDFQKKTTKIIDQTEQFRNLYSTPWIGDLDQDGYLDIIYCQNFNPQDFFRFLGMRVKRISTSIPMNNEVKWGSYLGTDGDGVFTE